MRALAVKDGLDDATLLTLERRYCGTKSASLSAPPLPSPSGGQAAISPECEEFRLLAVLARIGDAAETVQQTIDHQVGRVCSQDGVDVTRWPAGGLARSSTGALNYPQGKTAKSTTGNWYYPNGTVAKYATGSWNYPDGKTARYSDGSWRAPKGGATTAQVVLEAACAQRDCSEVRSTIDAMSPDLKTATIIGLAWQASKRK
ncbi:MAG: hypothetical protein HYZ28_17075 [Myxococcales bacterium]|nr:hypothetical protein [Myxococcales bacterium]